MIRGAFGEVLVFDVDHRDAGTLEFLDRAHHVDGLAVPRARVGEDGNVHGLRDALGNVHLLRHGQHGLRRHEVARRHPARAREGLESHPLQDAGEQGIVRAGDDDVLAGCEKVAELAARRWCLRHGVLVFLNQF